MNVSPGVRQGDEVIEHESKTVAAAPLWRNRDFRLLFGAQVVSLLGSGVTTVGLALFAYRLTGGASATAVIGNALTLRILAFLLFSQPAGVIADRASRKKILIASDLLRFGLLALFPLVNEVRQVYALIFAVNAVTAFFNPTYEASIPEVVGDEHYVRALSLSRVAVDVEAVASPAVAGLLVALLGVRRVFWFDAFTYLVSALLVAAATVPHVAKALTPLSLSTFLSEITTGTRILLREPSLRQALIAIPSSTLLAEHTAEEERGRAYAAHFALTHACRLITYPTVGHAASRWGAPVTFTAAGVLCLLVTAAAGVIGKGAGGAHSHERVHAEA